MVSTLANASNERWLLHLNPSLRKARLSLATSHSRSKLHFRNCICRLRIGGGSFAKGQLYRLPNVGRYRFYNAEVFAKAFEVVGFEGAALSVWRLRSPSRRCSGSWVTDVKSMKVYLGWQ